MSIYEQMKAAGVPIASHYSDLYAKVTEESRAIVASYRFKANVTTFTNQVEGGLWYDIPFAFDPFWAKLDSQLSRGESLRESLCADFQPERVK